MSAPLASDSTEAAQRRERAAIAAQACQTCRNRKSKCDEQRPKCGLCRRLDLECVYREPLPTKKDKTMVHILDTLVRLETKFDNLHLNQAVGSPEITQASHRPSTTSASPAKYESLMTGSTPPRTADGHTSEHHLTLAHQIILWPSVYLHILNLHGHGVSDLHIIFEEGFSWFVKHDVVAHHTNRLSTASLSEFVRVNPGDRRRSTFSNLTHAVIHELVDSYFHTFNSVVPILNKESFRKDVLDPVLNGGFGEDDAESILILLVLALGRIADEGVFEKPLNVVGDSPSGFRGGSITRPPGIEMFNEARKRKGFTSPQISLINVQIQLLEATYYDAIARPLDSWRVSMAASQACLILIKLQSMNWQSPHGDLVKRAYWACVLREDLYHFAPHFPKSGIQQLEDVVPSPHYQESQRQTSLNSSLARDDDSLSQYHFLAMISLRRLILKINSTVHEFFQNQPESMDTFTSPPSTTLRDMNRQLDAWRSLLPRPLQWDDRSPLAFPNSNPIYTLPRTSTTNPTNLFSPDTGPLPVRHKSALDLNTALLRSHFLHARFTLHLPLLFKALHFPELMTSDDSALCAQALSSTLLWPIAMAPPKNKKRLIPDVASWTQRFINVLLILCMASLAASDEKQEGSALGKVYRESMNREDLRVTVMMMLDWVRDVQLVDPVARWSWGLLEGLHQQR